MHRSLAIAEQVEHAPPPVPQALVDWGSQTFPLQQPVGQLVGLQTQVPFTQAWPIAQTPPRPHAHAPPAQESARVPSHPMHVAPSVPHCVAEGVTQVEPEQHPVGHEPFAPVVHVQTPPTHA